MVYMLYAISSKVWYIGCIGALRVKYMLKPKESNQKIIISRTIFQNKYRVSLIMPAFPNPALRASIVQDWSTWSSNAITEG